MKTAKKLTSAELRKVLSKFSSEELKTLIVKMNNECPNASLYLNFQLGDEEFAKSVLEETREKIRRGFFSKSGRGRLNYMDAKAEIENFSGFCNDPVMILDLQISFVENAVQMAGYYRNLPDAFFRSAESVFKTIIRMINDSSDQNLYSKFQTRLDRLISDSIGADSDMHASLENIYSQLKLAETEEAPSELSVERQLSSRATAGETLSEEDSKLFYKIWLPLLDFVNEKKHVNDIGKMAGAEGLDTNKVSQIADELWGEKSLIDDYLKEKENELTEDEKYILRGWKKAITGRFILERHLKKGSVFISASDYRVYLVHGITTSWEEVMMGRPCPIVLDMTLIPFRDVLTFDGIVFLQNVWIGGGMAKSFKETYMTAKRSGKIIDSL